jgi:putative flippase GtrA
VSASVVAIFSFHMNRRFVFKKTDTAGTKLWLFMVITLSGIFLVQSATIALCLPIVKPLAGWLAGLSFLRHHLLTTDFYQANLAKVAATATSMIWNYTLYKKVVFKG